jgi:PAS domain S-box-containing protein
MNEQDTHMETLHAEMAELRMQLQEANETIEAIRTGQVDALIVQHGDDHQLYTLRTADQSYRVFIEKMTEGAVNLSIEGIITYCNSTFAGMTGHTLSDVIGSSFENFISEEDKSYYRELFAICLESDCKGEVLLTAGDLKIPVQLSLTSLEMEEGKKLSVIVTDVTAQKKTQAQLQENNHQLAEINNALSESNHDLQQFASVASHDLQEPLRKIHIFSNLLRDKDLENLSDESKKYLEKIISSAGRMKMLVIDMLDYSKLSANQHSFTAINLGDTVKEVLEDLELIALEKNAVISTEGLPSLDANKGQMRQVFQNIIYNALKFAKHDEHPRIQITGRRIALPEWDSAEDAAGNYCLISIKDNGIGFDEKYAGNIFALFERLNSKDKYEGTGIGLAITKKIVEKHHGMIKATSREGEGADFLIILPVHQ